MTTKTYKIRFAPVVEPMNDEKTLNSYAEAYEICSAVGILADQREMMYKAINYMKSRTRTQDRGRVYMVVHSTGVYFTDTCNDAKQHTDENIGRQNVYNVIRVEWWGNGNVTIYIK